MKAKNFFRIASVVMLLSITLPVSAKLIAPAYSPITNSAKTEDPRVQQLLQRLQDIKGMNKSEMTSQEKKGLRKEVKEIKKEMKRTSKGIYLSVGAVIIIILLLILIL